MRFHSHKTKGLSIGLSKGLSIGKKTVENQCFKVFVTNKRSSHSHTHGNSRMEQSEQHGSQNTRSTSSTGPNIS